MLALGKHGAGELNYSSDIDLVVFYDPQAQSLPDIYEAPKLYSRLAQGLVKLLSERTGHGYVHRVDYRLPSRSRLDAFGGDRPALSLLLTMKPSARTGSAPPSSRRARSPATCRSARIS